MKTITIALDNPLTRGDQKVSKVVLRRPTGAELRGVSLLDLMRIDTTAVCEVLPRISTPALTKQELAAMDAVTLVELGAAVSSFLVREGDDAPASAEGAE